MKPAFQSRRRDSQRMYCRPTMVATLCIGWLFGWIANPIPRLVTATDFVITIGGGYEPVANQASLEANVLFFDEVLKSQANVVWNQATYFADGNDPEPDLQFVTDSDLNAAGPDASEAGPAAPQSLVRLLENLNAGRDAERLSYRNHRIDPVAGANVPPLIEAGLKQMTSQMRAGDRLIVYVTAHGGESKSDNPYNTTISCWDDQSISARQFERWLDSVPSSVPVVLVMAQCYCGGFAHTIFNGANRENDLSPQLRVGFFAQQHDLPAAGCRPDIKNDEEYSSFFWGAFLGKSRNGRRLDSADFNGDGRISFAEAHARAVLTSETIDLPLRSSEALLRVYSRIGGGYDHRRDGVQEKETADETGDDPLVDNSGNNPTSTAQSADLSEYDSLAAMVGSIRELTEAASAEYRETVVGLSGQLNIDLDSPVTSVFELFEEQRDEYRELERAARRNRRGGSGRRQLRQELARQWPELVSPDWRSSDLLTDEGQGELLERIAQLPSYERYETNRNERQRRAAATEQAELLEVKYQRLVDTLEAIVLARNLERVASREVVLRYRQMLQLEQSGLSGVK